jgi:phage-related minor tail protein
MQRIKMTNMEMYALVDDEDYKRLNKYKWRMNKRGYACTSVWLKGTGKGTVLLMHRLVLNTPKGMDTEHRDQNKLNNQKSNLRVATRSQNMMNVIRKNNPAAHSKYKGVSKLNRPNLKNKWLAYIRMDYKMHYFGYYATQEEAAHVYNQAAEQLFGDFASLNEITSD